MSGMWAVFRRELASLFHSSLGLLCLVLFYAVAAFIFYFKAPPWIYNAADLNPGFFGYAPIYLLALVPLLALRTWADEYRGAMELLLTLPLRTEALVLGKFLALAGFVWLLLAATLPLPLTLGFLGSPDWAAIGAGYLALGLLAALFAAVGLFFSALNENPIAGAIATFLTCFLLYALGLPAWLQALPPPLATVSTALSVFAPFAEIAAGRLSLPGACYFVTVILFFLALTTLRLQMYKWAQLFSPTARRHTLPAIGAMLLLAAATYGLNLVFRVVRYDYIDLTANRQYTLSPQTEKTLAGLSQRITVRAYFSTEPPTEQAAALRYARTLLERYRAAAHGQIDLQYLDPNTDPALLNLAAHYGIPADIRESQTAGEATRQRLFHAVQVLYADRAEKFAIDPQDPGGLEEQLTVAIRAVVANTQPQVLLWENVAGAHPIGTPDQDPLPGPTEALYLTLREGRRYSIEWRDFSQPIPPGTRLVILHDPKEMPAEAAWGLQEFVRGGGAVLICAATHSAPSFPEVRLLQRNLPAMADLKKTGLETLLDGWGLRLKPGLLLDRSAFRPVLLPSREPGRVPSPVAAFPELLNLSGDGLNPQAPFTAGFQRLYLNYISPVQVATAPPEGIHYEWLVRTTPDARLITGDRIPVQPWAAEVTREAPGDGERQLVAVYGRGIFPEVLQPPPPDKRPPVATPDGAADPSQPQPGVVVLFGSASLLHETVELHGQRYEAFDLGGAKQTGLQVYLLQMINRLTGAQDLLELQAKQQVARPLTRYAALPSDERAAAYEQLAWLGLVVPSILFLAAGLTHLKRRHLRSSRIQPPPLTPAISPLPPGEGRP